MRQSVGCSLATCAALGSWSPLPSYSGRVPDLNHLLSRLQERMTPSRPELGRGRSPRVGDRKAAAASL